MSEIFLKIINMSISASYIVLAVLLLRLLLKKAPKWITVALWSIVAVRLACPFSIESVLSLIPSAEVVSPEIMLDRTPEINTGIPIVNEVVNPIIGTSFAPDPATSANPLQLWIPTFALFWIVGMAALLIYTVISYVRVRRKIGTAVLYKDNIYQSENVVSPFVLGIIKPKIYLPFSMNEKDMGYVVAHEMSHIRRKDHIWKPFGFLLLMLHWFNPLMWLGYILLCRDIELACDEKVIKELDRDARADYSEALLTCSVNRRMIAACPLAFGEVGVKDRVKSVLNYKKPAFWIIIAAVVACIVVSVCFLTDPVSKSENHGDTDPDKLSDAQIDLMEQRPEYFGLDASDGLDVYVWQMVQNSYSFGLLPHSEQPRDWLSQELLNLRGTNAEEMRIILSTYNVDENKIYVIPWQNPISSYIGEWQIVADGEDLDAKREGYVEYIRQMLFGIKRTLIYSAPVYSYVMSPSAVPEIEIEDGVIYTITDGSKERLGTVTRKTINYFNFDSFIKKYEGFDNSELARELRKNNKIAYEVTPDASASGIEIYYIMEQKDGEMLIVYGHYENGEMENVIRFIYSMVP